MKIVNLSFAPRMPAAPLHWMLADRSKCLVLEAVEEGLKVYENPFGVLTNNPPFPFHQMNMGNYLNLTSKSPKNRFSEGLVLKPCSQGMGALDCRETPPHPPVLSGPPFINGIPCQNLPNRLMFPSFSISWTEWP